MCACGFRHHRQDRVPKEDLATRICAMLIEHQVSLRRRMATLLDREPGSGCIDLPLFHVSNGETSGAYKGEKLRFIVLEDVKGQTVTIWLESSPLGLEEFVPKAQKVIDSV